MKETLTTSLNRDGTPTNGDRRGLTAAERRSSDPEFSTAELAECQCPDFCERDHDRD